MEEKTIFARAVPKVLEVAEQYWYHADIAANDNLQTWHDECGNERQPEGRLVIKVPYDGACCVTATTIRDVERQVGRGRRPTDVRIGYLALDGYGSTNLAELLKIEPTLPVIPIDLPFEPVVPSGGLCALPQNKEFVLTVAYSPKWPEIVPIQVDTHLLDEQYLLSLEGEKKQEDITQHATFERSFLVQLVVTVRVPKKVAEQVRPVLREMTLQWPQIISQASVNLTLEEKPFRIRYDPERGTLSWKDVSLAYSKDEATGYVAFSTPQMELRFSQPTALYGRESLVGRMTIELPDHLMSGLQVSIFGATGSRLRDIPVAKHTMLLCEFALYLEDRFLLKVYSPVRHLEFPGVIVDEMRIHDIVLLLKDLAFEVVRVEGPSHADTGRVEATISARKIMGKDYLWLLMYTEGRRATTTQETQIRGGKTFITDVTTGNMTIDLMGRFDGDGATISRILGEIQASLKERFSYTAIPA